MMNYEEEQQHKAFDEFLDECYAPYKIGDYTFYPSDIMKSCDPVMYRCAFNDWVTDKEAGIDSAW